MKSKIVSMFDYVMILLVLSLVTIGILFIYSSGVNSDGISVKTEYIKQIIWASIGLVLMILLTLYDYRRISSFIIYFYGGLIIALIYTRLFGRVVNGAKSWIGIGEFGIQPSELGKVIYILMLAHFLDDSANTEPLKRFALATLILILPFGIIMLQPDLGTASVYIPVFLIMCFVADIPLRLIMYVLLFGMMTIVFAVLPVWNSEIAANPLPAITILTNLKFRIILISAITLITVAGIVFRRYLKGKRYIFWITYFTSIIDLSLIFSLAFGKVLKDYQIKRLIIFMNPEKDRLGAGWNIIQSKIAIGAGGIFGRGYLDGTQSHYQFLPQQSTDFIFSILSEEVGFVGCAIVFALYFLIMMKILLIMRKCPNRFGTYICAGVFGMFVFHFMINVGMVMGMMPITGIPLLFLSYGGSSLITAMSCLGLVMSVNSRKGELK